MSTEHRPHLSRRVGLLLSIVVVMILGACSVPVPTEPPRPPSPDGTGLPFPRTAAVFLLQEDIPPLEEFARYDVVIMDSEWQHRLPASFFTALRELNPTVTVLAYVNLIDKPNELGTPEYYANRYSLWQFNTSSTSSFPREWIAQTSDGVFLHQFETYEMTNLTVDSPTVDGVRFFEYAADWVVQEIWSTGLWDGVFLDVWNDEIYGASRTSWDFDGDGRNEPDSQIYGAGMPWGRGLDGVERILRERMPDAVLVGNGIRELDDELLDGRMWESFADPLVGRDPDFDLQNYIDTNATGGYRQPGVALTINRRPDPGPLSVTDLRRARYFLTKTMLHNGYWAAAGVGYDDLLYYDEFDGGGLGRGYLGQPLDGNPTWAGLTGEFRDGLGSVGGNVYRRDFENGIVLHNASDQPQRVVLERAYRSLRGIQDPVVNDGALVDVVTVPARDGRVLLSVEG